MKYAIQGYVVDKNSLPEVFGEAISMWVLAPKADPTRILLCTPTHPADSLSSPALRSIGLQPEDCFFRLCMVEVKGTSEIVVGEDDLPSRAWQLPDGTYVVEPEEST